MTNSIRLPSASSSFRPSVDDDGSRRLVTADEGLRHTTLEGLAALRPAFVAERMEAHWAQLMPLTHAAFNAHGRVAP